MHLAEKPHVGQFLVTLILVICALLLFMVFRSTALPW
jgi:hypothetical protein